MWKKKTWIGHFCWHYQMVFNQTNFKYTSYWDRNEQYLLIVITKAADHNYILILEGQRLCSVYLYVFSNSVFTKVIGNSYHRCYHIREVMHRQDEAADMTNTYNEK